MPKWRDSNQVTSQARGILQARTILPVCQGIEGFQCDPRTRPEGT